MCERAFVMQHHACVYVCCGQVQVVQVTHSFHFVTDEPAVCVTARVAHPYRGRGDNNAAECTAHTRTYA